MSLRSAQQDRGDKDQDDGQDQRDRKPFQLPDGGHTHSASLAPGRARSTGRTVRAAATGGYDPGDAPTRSV